MSIHSTAIISPTAIIGQDVTVGPYCVVGDGVTLGDGCWLQNHVSIHGPSRIGARNRFFAHAAVGNQSQDLKYEREPTYLEVGSDNTFREFSTVNRGTAPESVTRVGSHNTFLAYTHIAHDCIVGDHCIFSNNGTLAGHVTVEDYVILGGFSAVHQFCRIGAHSITGGCTKIVKDVAPFMLVDGNPAKTRGLNHVGLQRRGFTEEAIRALKEAYKCIYMRKINVSQAVTRLEEDPDPRVQQLVEFIKTSTRGIT